MLRIACKCSGTHAGVQRAGACHVTRGGAHFNAQERVRITCTHAYSLNKGGFLKRLEEGSLGDCCGRGCVGG